MDLITLAMAKRYTDEQIHKVLPNDETVIYPKEGFTRTVNTEEFGVEVAFFEYSEPLILETGKTYIVHLDTRTYESAPASLEDGTMILGNGNLIDPDLPDTDNPFVCVYFSGEGYGFVVDKLLAESCYIAKKNEVNDPLVLLEMTTALPSDENTQVSLSGDECGVLNQMLERINTGEILLPIVFWTKDNESSGIVMAQFVLSAFCGFVFETMDAVAGEPGRYVLATDGTGGWAAVKRA